MLLPRDIKSQIVHAVCNMFAKKTSEIVAIQASYYRQKTRVDLRVPSKQAKDVFFKIEDKIINFQDDHIDVRKEVSKMDMKIRLLMLSVSTNRTQIHFGHRHLCMKHEKVVDKNHIDDCDLLIKDGRVPRQYNELLKKSLYDMTLSEVVSVRTHFSELAALIA